MDVPFFKFKVKFSNKTEQIKTFLKIFCLLNNIHLTPQEIDMYVYFVVYGIKEETKKLITDSQLVKNEQSIKNALTKFRKIGLIKKKNEFSERKNIYLLDEKFELLKNNKFFGALIKFDKEE